MRKKLFILLIFALSIIPVITLFHPGLPITHDGQDHVARIANFYQNLLDGNLVPRWGANLNWGYGHPILEFLYPLPSYIASVFHFLSFSLVDSVKIVFGLGMVISLLSMYLWLAQFLSKYAALFGAILYTYAPYRFVETYVRGDIGENLAFAFIPLVLFFLYKSYKKSDYKYTLLGGISLALLILSHNAISLMFVPFIFLYGIFLLYLSKNNRKYLINFISIFLLGFLVSIFFWLPALLEGKYTLRNIVTKGAYITSFTTIAKLIYGPWSYGGSGLFTVQLGPFSWLAVLFSPVLIFIQKKNNDKNFIFSIFLLIYTLFAVFLMLPVSNFIWSKSILLQNFQFPWRFLAITVFASAVIGALVLDNVFKKIKISVLTVSILVILFISSFYLNAKGYLQKPESFFTGIYKSTTDTGESSPIWSIRFMEKTPPAHLEVIDGDGKIKELTRTSTYHKYQINVNKPTLLKENTLYFPGWEILANGKPLNVEFQNMNYRGVMLFHLTKGNYNLEVKYQETKLRLIADIISLISIAALFGFISYKLVKLFFS